jgi:hypothetical protein
MPVTMLPDIGGLKIWNEPILSAYVKRMYWGAEFRIPALNSIHLLELTPPENQVHNSVQNAAMQQFLGLK